MPPSPAYSWFCVLCSTANILSHAAQHRASQLTPRTAVWLQQRREAAKPGSSTGTGPVKSKNASKEEIKEGAEAIGEDRHEASVFLDERASVKPKVVLEQTAARSVVLDAAKSEALIFHEKDVNDIPIKSTVYEDPLKEPETENASFIRPQTPDVRSGLENQPDYVLPDTTDRTVISEISQKVPVELLQPTEFITPARNLQSSKVPSSRIGRLFHYGGLAASLGYGAASELLQRTGGASSDGQSSVFMTEANIKRLVSKLSQMRGAALKLGQFLSIQDTNVLPVEVDQIFRRVQDSAHYMPNWQMEKVMIDSLGPNWAQSFESFDPLPFAAASIGQVHGAVLAASASPTGRPEPVAVKIQFPNIVNSIDSDLSYIKVLLTAGRLLPKGLFLDRSVQVLKDELADECDYTREGSFLTRFRSTECLGGDERFKVPWVWEGSTKSVLVMERMHGASVGDADISGMSKRDRDDIAAWILELCLKELFEFRAMQTDPNWSNFLWNAQTRTIELVDFGATREYTQEFMDKWLRLLQAAASEDRDACIKWSLELGYLTGEENEVMLDAHVKSMILLATPFRTSTKQPFEFGQGSAWSDITAEIRSLIPVMLMHRLTPPPRETYSLNRKLSGTFLLASRLGATIDTKAIWDRVVSQYRFSS